MSNFDLTGLGNLSTGQTSTIHQNSAGQRAGEFRTFLDTAIDDEAGHKGPAGPSQNVAVPRPLVPGPGDTVSTDASLVRAAGMIKTFLAQYPAIANSPFGNAVNLLLHMAGDVTEADAAAGLPPYVRNKLTEAVTVTVEYMLKHPSLLASPIGKALLELASEVLDKAGTGSEQFDQTILNRLLHAVTVALELLSEKTEFMSTPLGKEMLERVLGLLGNAKSDNSNFDKGLMDRLQFAAEQMEKSLSGSSWVRAELSGARVIKIMSSADDDHRSNVSVDLEISKKAEKEKAA